jgi:hypothetical protein
MSFLSKIGSNINIGFCVNFEISKNSFADETAKKSASLSNVLQICFEPKP